MKLGEWREVNFLYLASAFSTFFDNSFSFLDPMVFARLAWRRLVGLVVANLWPWIGYKESESFSSRAQVYTKETNDMIQSHLLHLLVAGLASDDFLFRAH